MRLQLCAFLAFADPSVALQTHGLYRPPTTRLPGWTTSTTSRVNFRTSPSSSVLSMGLLDGLLDQEAADAKLFAKDSEEYMATLTPIVERINSLEPSIEDLSDEELAAKTVEFRKRIANGEELGVGTPLTDEAFAVVREAAWRVLEQRHYDVQVTAGLALLQGGRAAEMGTGEGKTLVATLPCYVNALLGKGAMVVTVNDYLARRDSERMGQVHRFLGLSVGLVQGSSTTEQRKEAYGSDVTYVTNSELGFDFLRDHLALSKQEVVLPIFEDEIESDIYFPGYCLVDECDSVLIDEARTPLIISKQADAPGAKYATAAKLAAALTEDVHFDIDLKNKNVVLTERGYTDCEAALGVDSLFTPQGDGSGWAPYVVNAIKAAALFKKDVDYTLLKDAEGKDAGVGIIDAFTGRVMDGRRWSDGLHQSVEAMEGMEVSKMSQVIATVTYQSLFRQFARLSGMSGTAMPASKEFISTYGLLVTPIPTALPIARRDYPDVTFKTRAAADRALIKEIQSVGGGELDGRPCLIGTTSVEQSEGIVASLAASGIPAELLNASPLNAAREGEIIAQAGRPGVVTVATNMAGRGTDILLGGCAGTMSKLLVRGRLAEAGVLAEGEASKLPPSPPAEYYPCKIAEDVDSLVAAAARAVKKAYPEGMGADQLSDLLTVAADTTEAEDDPAHVVELRDAAEGVKETFKGVLEPEKEAVLKRGGLYVMGTARHESSRIDAQLRGRSGRQGDPGTSRFFLSFEDEMYVTFGGDGVTKILEMFRVSEDMPVEAPQVTESLDRVQKNVEDKYAEIREQVTQFDSVLNGQRGAIYARRRAVLFGDDDLIVKTFIGYNEGTVNDIVTAQGGGDGEPDVDGVLAKAAQFFPGIEMLVRKEDIAGKDVGAVRAYILAGVEELFKANTAEMERKAKAAGSPAGAIARTARYTIQVTMDNAWSQHLQNMEALKENVVLRQYRGLDPVKEYKEDALTLFGGLEDDMRRNAVYSLWQSMAAQAK